MPHLPLLYDLLVILALSVAVVFLFQKLRQPVVVGAEHAAFSGSIELADLGGGDPIDQQGPNGSIGHPNDSRQNIFFFAVDSILGFGVNPDDFCLGHIAHDVQIVHSQVYDHTNIVDSYRKRTLAACLNLEYIP